jgi:hypothetical protein
MSDTAGWCLIESDPGVFTELIRELGKTKIPTEVIHDFRVLLIIYFEFVRLLFQACLELKLKNCGRWTAACLIQLSEDIFLLVV